MFTGPNIVTNGLVLNLDAANTRSYPGSGTTWNDLSGNGNNGTLTNGPTFSSANGGAIIINATGDYVNLGNILNIGTGPFSLEVACNVYATTINYGKVVSKGYYLNGGFTIYAGKDATTGTYAFNIQYGNNTTGWLGLIGDSVAQNGMAYLTVTRDQNNIMTTYAFGKYITEKVETFNFTTNYNYVIGANSQLTERFKGAVYFYRHYNRALSASEVLQNYNGTKSRISL